MPTERRFCYQYGVKTDSPDSGDNRRVTGPRSPVMQRPAPAGPFLSRRTSSGGIFHAHVQQAAPRRRAQNGAGAHFCAAPISLHSQQVQTRSGALQASHTRILHPAVIFILDEYNYKYIYINILQFQCPIFVQHFLRLYLNNLQIQCYNEAEKTPGHMRPGVVGKPQ